MGGAHIGNWVDTANRLHGTYSLPIIPQTFCAVVRVSLLVQNLSVFGCGALQYFLFRFAGVDVPWKNALFLLTFGAMNILGGSARLASVASEVAVTKDWIVVIAQGDTKRLSRSWIYFQNSLISFAEMNAVMRRINLMSKVFAPLVTQKKKNDHHLPLPGCEHKFILWRGKTDDHNYCTMECCIVGSTIHTPQLDL